MAISPPGERIWWKEPIARIELIWIGIAFVWGLVMFFMMIYWHGAGEQNLSSEAYKMCSNLFEKRHRIVRRRSFIATAAAGLRAPAVLAQSGF